jgi:hypothetical protein
MSKYLDVPPELIPLIEKRTLSDRRAQKSKSSSADSLAKNANSERRTKDRRRKRSRKPQK